jgi:hypothetical protein
MRQVQGELVAGEVAHDVALAERLVHRHGGAG